MGKTESPDVLHWLGLALVAAGYLMLLRLMIMEGFAAVFIGAGVGFLGCELEKRRGRKDR